MTPDSAAPGVPEGSVEPGVPGPTLRSKRRRAARVVFEWTKSASLAVLLFLFLKTFLVEAFRIPSGSMEGTLLPGDFLLVNKLVYGAEVPFTGKRLPGLRQPKNGDVLVFLYPKDPTQNFVKRLVGSPGDTVSMDHGVLVRNGVRQVESYTRHVDPNYDLVSDDFYWQRSFLVPMARAAGSYHASRDNWGPIVVPQRHYFVLGDNRDNSLDSRFWGFVPDSLVRGSPLVIYYSFAPDSSTALDWLTHVRWKRLFSPVR